MLAMQATRCIRTPLLPVKSVAVSVRLERTFDRHADVVGLGLGQFSRRRRRNRGPFPAATSSSSFFGSTSTVRRSAFWAGDRSAYFCAEQEDLRQYLVGERTVHDAARVAGGVAEVNQAAFRQQDQVVVVLRVEAAGAGTVDLVNLRLHFFPLPSSCA